MSANDEDDATIYTIVINAEEQYSIWPADKAVPPGWRAIGKEAAKAECLSYIDAVWTDMRPRSLRLKMDEAARASGAAPDRK